MTDQLPQESQTAKDLLIEHFPEVEWTEGQLDFYCNFLSPSWLTAGSLVEAVEAKVVNKRLDNIERLAANLWTEYHKLPLQMRAKRLGDEEHDLWRRLMKVTYDITGKTPFVVHGAGQEIVARAMPRKMGALRRMRERASNFFPMHHNQRQCEFSSKVHLVTHCRELWLDLKGEDAPVAPSAGAPFYNFVGDVIMQAGKEWSVDVTLRKHRMFTTNE